MQTFAVKFEQHCEGAQPALRGQFDWRLNDTIPPAPWMEGASSTTATGSTSGSAPASSSGSPMSAAEAGTALLTLASSPRRVLLSSLVALLQRQSGREAQTLALFARAPTAGQHRRQALSAISHLLSAVLAARHDLSSPSMRASARMPRRRLLAALAAWRTILARQRTAVGSAVHPSMRRLNREAAARAANALRALRLFRRTM